MQRRYRAADAYLCGRQRGRCGKLAAGRDRGHAGAAGGLCRSDAGGSYPGRAAAVGGSPSAPEREQIACFAKIL